MWLFWVYEARNEWTTSAYSSTFSISIPVSFPWTLKSYTQPRFHIFISQNLHIQYTFSDRSWCLCFITNYFLQITLKAPKFFITINSLSLPSQNHVVNYQFLYHTGYPNTNIAHAEQIFWYQITYIPPIFTFLFSPNTCGCLHFAMCNLLILLVRLISISSPHHSFHHSNISHWL